MLALYLFLIVDITYSCYSGYILCNYNTVFGYKVKCSQEPLEVDVIFKLIGSGLLSVIFKAAEAKVEKFSFEGLI